MRGIMGKYFPGIKSMLFTEKVNRKGMKWSKEMGLVGSRASGIEAELGDVYPVPVIFID